MRKITQLAVNAFCNGSDFTLGNTCVYHDSLPGGGVSRLILHGNLIAEQYLPKHASETRTRITLAGWPTPTTRERINGLLDALGESRRVWQSKHAQFFGDADASQEIAADEWVTL